VKAPDEDRDTVAKICDECPRENATCAYYQELDD